MTNRLAHATSPYLRQHADNPVHWQEWGPEALAEAKERDVPIFLSVGYAACHWCHVMAGESFSDEAVADLVNRTSVPIKVDREERPDLDAVYMSATVAMTGHGGWPMSVWLTPEGQPFHAGTYFPVEPRHGLPSFTQVVTAVAEAWQERRVEVHAGAADIARQLAEHTSPPPPGELGPAAVDQAVDTLAESYDRAHPGFGTMPKFPPSMVLDFLLARATQAGGATADAAWSMASQTCRAMVDGGLFDQLGGGFARYCVDRSWTVPHFEKMLYDNALLLPVLARAVAEGTRRGEDVSRFTEAVELSVDWLAREMLTPQGAFASSLDADSDDGTGQHREGAHYVWTIDQMREVAGEQAEVAERAYRLDDGPNFEDQTFVLQRDPAVAVPDELRRSLM
ncbi:MAG TPA: thioredoxin domain-containing protein, partial [Candidatus Avipropionibacterium avicola]|nr:thioredoxin domain-containing protein [Candidatus Avipropionibacterium avicola]